MLQDVNNETLQNESPILSVKDLTVHYETDTGVVEALTGVNLQMKKGETLGLVGETGAGKSTLALSIMGLLPYPPSHVIHGEIEFEGNNLFELSNDAMRKIRGKKISMIFQDPMTALNPVQKVGDQIAEVIGLHQNLKGKELMLAAMDMLKMVGIQPERYNDYPHQFSGGMKQRVVIAMALACKPDLIIADEPTTALDVTIQAQILEMMRDLREQLNTSMLLITHDFGIVADICTKCAVIYAGEIVEFGTVEQIFDNPLHPYTVGLFNSLPSLEKDVRRLNPICGMMADPMNLPNHCSFYDRCQSCSERCREGDPQMIEVEPEHFVRCYRIAGGV